MNGGKDTLTVLIDNLTSCHKLCGHPVHSEVHRLTQALYLRNPLLLDDGSISAHLCEQVLTLLALHSLLHNLRSCEVGNGGCIAIDGSTIKRLCIRKGRTEACHRSSVETALVYGKGCHTVSISRGKRWVNATLGKIPRLVDTHQLLVVHNSSQHLAVESSVAEQASVV